MEKLEKLGDTAMVSKNHDEAIKLYSDALTLNPPNQRDILLKQSKVRAVMGSWEAALIDADKVWIVFHASDEPQRSILFRLSSLPHHPIMGTRGSTLLYMA